MLQYLETHANNIYAIAAVVAMIGVVFWEVKAPRRQPDYSYRVRWISNFGVYVLDAVIIRLMLPLSAIVFAALIAEFDWGLLNNISVPIPVAIVSSILVLDVLHYLKHVALHKIPLCWRFHRMHHSDLDFDFTTSLRFHPFEAIVNAVITMSAITALGIPTSAVVIYEILLVVSNFIGHGNVSYPRSLDDMFRTVLVTPDMHRIHHSAKVTETDSNYGDIFSIWDRVFRTYVSQPQHGHVGMTLGLLEFRDNKHQKLRWMLACPFLSTASNGSNHEHVTFKVQE